MSLMDGDISVESTPGSGSCFTVTFSLALEGDATLPEAPRPLPVRTDARPLPDALDRSA